MVQAELKVLLQSSCKAEHETRDSILAFGEATKVNSKASRKGFTQFYSSGEIAV